MDPRGLVLLSVVSLFLLSDHLSFTAAHIFGWRKAPELTDGSVLKLKTRRTVDPSRVEQISPSPRVFIYRGFLTNEECHHLISLATSKLEKSTVLDVDTGEDVESQARTSSGMFLDFQQDEIVAGIEERIAAWTFLPVENGEPIQVLRYEIGQQYVVHSDYFYDEASLKLGGNRAATVLMYLSNVAKGGETIFPNSTEKDDQQKDDQYWSECAKSGYAVKPEKGDALLFFSLNIDTTTDPFSEHASCPVIKGEKWSATKWIRVRPFGVEPADDPVEDGCTDTNPMCMSWASSGECEKNRAYMVGTDVHPGHCMKSCGACS